MTTTRVASQPSPASLRPRRMSFLPPVPLPDLNRQFGNLQTGIEKAAGAIAPAAFCSKDPAKEQLIEELPAAIHSLSPLPEGL